MTQDRPLSHGVPSPPIRSPRRLSPSSIAAIFLALYVPLYARATPKVGDFPFFYFYLLIYMPVVAIVLLDRHHCCRSGCGRPRAGHGRPGRGERRPGEVTR